MNTNRDMPRCRIGFGTGHLGSIIERAEAVNLVRSALDAGLTHIDTARLYGDGRAEAIVGEAIADRRPEIFLVSKGGILPAQNGWPRRILNKALSTGRRLAGDTLLPAPRWNKPRFGLFDVSDLRASLETSLEKLGTDYLDLFLLHEVEASHLSSGRVIQALQDWVKEGVIRSYGIASTPLQSRDLLASGVGFSFVQTAASVFDCNANEFVGGEHKTITHSWLGPALSRFRRAFEMDQDLATMAGGELSIDVRQSSQLAAYLLRHALASNPEGTVLFSTRSPERIREMVRTADGGALSPEEHGRLMRVVARVADVSA